ncbi:DUF2877 domain-containing protein [Brevibacillus laterosporus]|uniref:DUF2877 domain-containing protein n=1 Tax=Brevibacillus laterosporus TaxID=1465 RepID=A0AAP8QBV2_BRELA|nr:DUF2877 domain-containing protein [Brevibacillus laterosporus]MED1664882.1 DUF2877 domain-containing protein [Brevibacillus laterosporus]MED1671464.1 DUF2877 domain-containing protein [Brevibacillus laterosporus]MED1717507.1 DUF2877 domain-containing protein [Brevibacillus laterosporus]PPA87605.1 hypothetical protein C4A76_11830 [Brevibacillus laterosporus]PPA93845.1 hypothetical protein C4A77_16190 [Brevibacillus laterosporus]
MKDLLQINGMYSQSVHPLLQTDKPGYIHSVFQNGWNIGMGDGLIFIGSAKNGLLPFGIHLEDRFLPKLISLIEQNEMVHFNDGMSALLFSRFCITLNPQHAYHLCVGPITRDPQSLLHLLDAFATELVMHSRPTGADISVEHFIQCHMMESFVCCSEREQKVLQLMDVALTENLSQIDEILRYWIGRGKGLTPSGDDMLVGLLAVDAVTEVLTDSFRLHLSRLVEREDLTTDISREYLKYALKRDFSSVVTDVLHSLLQNNSVSLNERTRELLRVGHSSGLDTAFGILIGLLIIRRNSNWHKKL